MNMHYDVHDDDDDQAERVMPHRLRTLRLGGYPLGHGESADQLAGQGQRMRSLR